MPPIVKPITSQDVSQINQWLQCLIEISKIGGGFVLGYFAHILVVRREERSRVRKAKDNFLVVLAHLDAELDKRINQLKEFHGRSIAILKPEVFILRHFITAASFASLNKLLSEYEELSAENLDWGLSMSRQAVHAALSPDKPNPHMKADDLLKNYMRRFREEVELCR